MFGLFKRRIKIEAPEPEEAPFDQANADKAMLIKAKCDAGTAFARRLYDPEEHYADQFARYEEIRNDCIDLADEIGDEFYRAYAVQQIVAMCVIARDMGVARALVIAVRDPSLRQKIVEVAPLLKTA